MDRVSLFRRWLPTLVLLVACCSSIFCRPDVGLKGKATPLPSIRADHDRVKRAAGDCRSEVGVGWHFNKSDYVRASSLAIGFILQDYSFDCDAQLTRVSVYSADLGPLSPSTTQTPWCTVAIAVLRPREEDDCCRYQRECMAQQKFQPTQSGGWLNVSVANCSVKKRDVLAVNVMGLNGARCLRYDQQALNISRYRQKGVTIPYCSWNNTQARNVSCSQYTQKSSRNLFSVVATTTVSKVVAPQGGSSLPQIGTGVPSLPPGAVAQCNRTGGGMSMSPRFCRIQAALQQVRARAGHRAKDNDADDNAKYISESLDDAEELANDVDGDELTEDDVVGASEWVSYIVGVGQSASIGARPDSGNRLLRLLPKLFRSGAVAGSKFSSTQPNFAVALEDVTIGQHYPGATFVVFNSSGSNLTASNPELMAGRRDLTSLVASAPTAAVVLPENITFYSREAASSSASVVVQFSVMTDTAMFEVNETDEFGADNFTLSSVVVTSQVGNSSVTGLREPVSIVFTGTQVGSNATCVFWSYDLNDEFGGWSSAGCWLNSSTGDVYTCQCNHLTTFAILLSARTTPVTVSTARRYTAVVGLSISSALVFLTILCLLGVRSLRRDMANRLLIHFCAMLMAVNIVTIVNYQLTPAKTSCIIINSLLQYFGLSLYCWALVQAIHFYRLLVTVFNKEVSRFHLKAVVFSYSVPAVICLVTMATGSFSMTAYYPNEGSNPSICFLRFYYESLVSLIIPISVIVLVNLIIFLLVMRVAFRHNAKKRSLSTASKAPDQKADPDFARQARFLRASMLTFIVLGLTWLVGLVSLAFDSEVADIFFTALLASVGTVIFVLKILLAEPVRNAVVLRLTASKTRRRRSSVMSTSSKAATPSSVVSNCSHAMNSTGHCVEHDPPRSTSSYVDTDLHLSCSSSAGDERCGEAPMVGSAMTDIDEAQVC